MSNNVEFIIIPHFVEEALARNNVSTNAVLNFHKVSRFLSINDIVQLLCVQGCWKDILSEPNFFYASSLMNHWVKSTSDPDDKKLLDQVHYLSSGLGQTKEEVYNRLFNKEQPSEETNKEYKLIDLKPNTYGLVIYQGYSLSGENRNSVLRDIIKSIGVYAPFNDVASCEFFDIYLKTLNK